MSDDFLLSVKNVSKKFCRDFRKSLYYGLVDIGCEILGRSNGEATLRQSEFWAVKDVSFEMKPGDSLAILGRNGAGKTTLMRMIAGRLRMDEGEIRIRGKVAAINELGAGFSPVQTGRENIYNSAAIYGLTRKQTDHIYERIVDFAEVRDFIDSPVANYSAGMRARLGYAITAFLKPDLFIMDEVLAVGDILFRKKCLEHLVKYRELGRSLIMSTHDLSRIQSICNRSIVMDHGKVLYAGNVLEGIYFFLDSMGISKSDMFSQDALIKVKNQVLKRDQTLRGERLTNAHRAVVISNVQLRSEAGEKIESGMSVEIVLDYHSKKEIFEATWGFSIYTTDEPRYVAGGFAGFEGRKFPLCQGDGQLRATIVSLKLDPGSYMIRSSIIGAGGIQLAEAGRKDKTCHFSVQPGNSYGPLTSNPIELEIVWR